MPSALLCFGLYFCETYFPVNHAKDIFVFKHKDLVVYNSHIGSFEVLRIKGEQTVLLTIARSVLVVHPSV